MSAKTSEGSSRSKTEIYLKIPSVRVTEIVRTHQRSGCNSLAKCCCGEDSEDERLGANRVVPFADDGRGSLALGSGRRNQRKTVPSSHNSCPCVLISVFPFIFHELLLCWEESATVTWIVCHYELIIFSTQAVRYQRLDCGRAGPRFLFFPVSDENGCHQVNGWEGLAVESH